MPTYPEDLQKRFNGKVMFQTVNENGQSDLFGPIIQLPLPLGLSFADTASYENAELGAIGGVLADPDKTLGNAASTYIGPAFRDQATKAVRDMAARIGGNRARATLGVTPNPNTRALFKQVNLREFQFTYKMIPQSDKEADAIRDIIKTFRQELYPTSTSTQPDDFQTGYFFPMRWEAIFFLKENGAFTETEELPRIKPAYLKAIQSTYNSGSSTMFVDPTKGKARFSEVDISLSFMESKTLFKPDIRDENF